MSFRGKKNKNKGADKTETSQIQEKVANIEVESESVSGSVEDPEAPAVFTRGAIVDELENPAKSIYEELTNAATEEPVGATSQPPVVPNAVEKIDEADPTLPTKNPDPSIPEPQADMGSYLRSFFVCCVGRK